MIQIWESKFTKENENKLPMIIPFVIYHGREKWNIAMTLGELINGYEQFPASIKKYIPNYEYLLYDLTAFPLAEIKSEAQLKTFLKILKLIYTQNVGQIMIVIQNVSHQVDVEKIPITYFETLIKYIVHARDDLPMDKLGKRMSEEGRKRLMTVADQLREEGKKEVAKRMLQLNMDDKQIIAATELPESVIEQLKKELNR